MADLIHGGDIYTAMEKGIREVTDFSANINPLGLPKGVKQAIIDGLDDCVNYPDPLCRELRRAISGYEGIPKEHILCGNGAADLIFRLALGKKPKRALVLAPTFAEYEIALKTVDCKVEQYYLKEENGFALTEEFINVLHGDLDAVFLCNPNNPTGRLIPREMTEKILEKCRELGILLVVDECFMDFIEDFKKYTMLESVEACKELFILKAFTKNYAMPGLRLGYCLSGDEALLAEMERMGQPWSVSLPAQLAGVRALTEKEYLEEAAALILKEKKYLLGELANLNIKTYPPAANYILLRFLSIETREQSRCFKDSLLEKGIIIRDCSNYKGLQPGYYRIAVKGRPDNEKLIKALKALINFEELKASKEPKELRR